jgi:hypothetical protein
MNTPISSTRPALVSVLAMLFLVFLQFRVSAQDNAIHFDGVDDEIYFPVSQIGPQQLSFTIEFWAKRDRADIEEVIFGFGDPAGGATGGALSIGFNALNEFFIDYGGQIQTHAWANDTEWHHWAITVQNPGFGVQYIYLDGQAVAFFTDLIVFDPLGANEMVLGRSLTTGADHFQGFLDELRIHSQWMNAYWFTNFYDCRIDISGFTNNNIIGHFTFDQGIAGDDNTLETQLIPSPISFYLDEGTLNNFTLNGATSNWVAGNVVNACPINLGIETNTQAGEFYDLCVNDAFSVINIYVNGFNVNPGADIVIELSDASGDFSSPIDYATIPNATNYEGVNDIPIPIGTPAGSGYRLRARCTDPVVVGLPSNPFQVAVGSLSGTITIGGSPVSNGALTLYSMNGDPAGWNAVHQAAITAGNYTVNNIYSLPFNWAMEVKADPVAYPEAITTFYSNAGPIHKWNAAGFNVADSYNCFNPNIRNLDILQDGLLNGTSTMSGFIFWQDGKVAVEDPIPLIDVISERVPPGSSFSQVTTDVNGFYSFDFVPESTTSQYEVFVNVPGIPMFDTYTIDVTEPGMTFPNLNFVVDTIDNFIYPLLVTNVPDQTMEDEQSLTLTFTPNPADHGTVIGLPKQIEGMVSYRVYAMQGQLVMEGTANTAGQFILLRTSDLPNSIYVVEVVGNDGIVLHNRLVVAH